MADQVAYAMPRTLRFRLRRWWAETTRRVRCWVLEDGTNGEGGMPNKWATLPAADVDALVAYMQSLK